MPRRKLLPVAFRSGRTLPIGLFRPQERVCYDREALTGFVRYTRGKYLMSSKFTGLSQFIAISILTAAPAFAGLVLNGGTGAISFGVAPYGGAPQCRRTDLYR